MIVGKRYGQGSILGICFLIVSVRWSLLPRTLPHRSSNDETGFAMRLEAVILPDLGTGPDTPIVVSHWFAARGDEVWEGDRTG